MHAGTIQSRNDNCLLKRDATIGPRGCAIIAPIRHVGSVFDLSLSEWEDSLSPLLEAKDHFHEEAAPGGYNVGWNEESVAGQETDHVRMFVIPRWADEPLAGRGIRYRLKQPANQRRSGLLDDLSGKTLLSGELCSFRRAGERTQVGSGVIITHDPNRETVFDLTPDEWRETFCLL